MILFFFPPCFVVEDIASYSGLFTVISLNTFEYESLVIQMGTINMSNFGFVVDRM